MRPHPTTPRADRQPSGPNPFELNRRVLRSDLSPAAKTVLLAILDHAGHGRNDCWASNRTLARETGITERHVSSIIGDLAARGLVRVERATGSKHSRRTLTLGPCMHQVGTPFRLRLHEVGTEFACGRKSEVHEVGTGFEQTSPEGQPRTGEFPPPVPENLSPAFARFFGRLLPPGSLSPP